MTDPESLSGGHYTPSEELDVFIKWGNELARQDLELAEVVISSMIDRTLPPQLPLSPNLVELDLELSKDPRQK